MARPPLSFCRLQGRRRQTRGQEYGPNGIHYCPADAAGLAFAPEDECPPVGRGVDIHRGCVVRNDGAAANTGARSNPVIARSKTRGCQTWGSFLSYRASSYHPKNTGTNAVLLEGFSPAWARRSVLDRK